MQILEAKDFLAQQTAEQARIEGVALLYRGVVRRRMAQPRRKRTAPMANTWRRGGSDQDWSMSLPRVSRGQGSRAPVPKSWRICAACAGIDGNCLPRSGSDSAARAVWSRPRPSEERRNRKMPLVSSASAPRAKTSGVAVNLASAGEKNQKEAAATARMRYRAARRGWYSRSPAKFSKKNSRRGTPGV